MTGDDIRVAESLRRGASDCDFCEIRKSRVQAKMWAHIEDYEAGLEAVGGRSRIFQRVAYSFLSVLLVVGVGTGTAVAADSSAPGDTLYPVDRVVEKVQLIVVRDLDHRTRMAIQQAEERIGELRKVRKRVSAQDMPRDEVTHVQMAILKDSKKSLDEATKMAQKKALVVVEVDSGQVVQDAVLYTYSDLDRIHQAQVQEVERVAAGMEDYEEIKQMRAQAHAQHRRVLEEIAHMNHMRQQIARAEAERAREHVQEVVEERRAAARARMEARR